MPTSAPTEPPRSAARAPLTVFLCLLFGLLAFFFYTTPFNAHVEAYLFDIRSRFKPQLKDVPDIVLVTITDATLQRLGVGSPRRLGIDRLQQLTAVLHQSQARLVAVLLFPNLFDFDDPQLAAEVESLRQDERFVVGTLGVAADAPSGVDVPPVLRPIAARTFGVDTLKRRSNSVVRTLPLAGYTGLARRPLLPRFLAAAEPGSLLTTAAPARLLDDTASDGDDWYALNYLAPASFRQIDAADLLAEPARFQADLAGHIVLVGQTAFREWMTQTREQMAVNTPLQGTADTYLGGESIVYVTANATENLLDQTWLSPARAPAALLQTALVTGISGAVWALGVVPAVLTITGVWVLLLALHGLLFQYLGIFVPLADTALFSSFAVLAGAVVRLNLDIQAQARIRTETAAKSVVARSHSRYLDQFSRAMAAANAGVAERLAKLSLVPPSSKADQDLLARAVSTSADFAEYLQGIMQCADAEGGAVRAVVMERVALAPLFATVVQRLEAKIQERRITLAVACDPGLAAHSNAHLLDNIVFNLLSNAVKYGQDGGSVAVHAQAEGRGVVIAVTDDGPGIAPEFQEKIFEKFYRVKNDDVYKIKGTGLGLYLCRYFAGRIGATVRCQSTLGSGATFSVALGRRR